MKGFVYLVGAGPGDPGLLTVAGAAAIREASAIVFDALVSDAILQQARPEAQCYNVGKRAEHHSATQEEINALLITLARADHIVARIKGGDPFVFGRGAEEAEELKRAEIPFRVIPGVTSAIAVPAAAGIPVTHRGLSASVAIVTAHRMDGADAPNWNALARMDTVVVLMGAERLASVAERLIAEGRAALTPVCCIQSGTLPEQRQVVGTLADIAEKVHAAALDSPLITVIGNVVQVREQIGYE